MAYIKELSQFEGKEVELKGWNAQKRDSKGLVFMTLRDGTGFVQCVINLDTVGNDQFEAAKRLPQESSLSLTGNVVKDERQVGGFSGSEKIILIEKIQANVRRIIASRRVNTIKTTKQLQTFTQNV